MHEYVAVIRLVADRSEGRLGLGVGASAALSGVDGVRSVQFDAASGSVLVCFHRGLVTLADLVRRLEDGGMTVSGIAQSRAGSRQEALRATA